MVEGQSAINAQIGFLPCKPNGCIELIKRTGCSIAGKTAVVIGEKFSHLFRILSLAKGLHHTVMCSKYAHFYLFKRM